MELNYPFDLKVLNKFVNIPNKSVLYTTSVYCLNYGKFELARHFFEKMQSFVEDEETKYFHFMPRAYDEQNVESLRNKLESQELNEQQSKLNEVLQHYDFAICLDLKDKSLHKIVKYLGTLTAYFGHTFRGTFSATGTYFAYRFNERSNLKCNLNKFRSLIINEFENRVLEETINGCHLFKIK
jgi:transcriptional regulator of heat shock response